MLLLLSCEGWQQGRLLLLLSSSKGRSLHLAAEARREKLLSLQASPLSYRKLDNIKQESRPLLSACGCKESLMGRGPPIQGHLGSGKWS